jgi:hypothetical protein
MKRYYFTDAKVYSAFMFSKNGSYIKDVYDVDLVPISEENVDHIGICALHSSGVKKFRGNSKVSIQVTSEPVDHTSTKLTITGISFYPEEKTEVPEMNDKGVMVQTVRITPAFVQLSLEELNADKKDCYTSMALNMKPEDAEELSVQDTVYLTVKEI